MPGSPGPGQHAGLGADPGTGVDLPRLIAVNTAAALFYRQQLAGPAAARARDYLAGRGLHPVVARDLPWRLGYAPPGWELLAAHLTRAGFTREDLVDAGLCRYGRNGRLIDRFRDRIMFPIRSPDGQIAGFTGRLLPGDQPPGTPKYINTPQTPAFTKGSLLFGLAEQQARLAAGWRPALVEGPTDVIATWLAHTGTTRPGTVAVAACGTAFTPDQARLLHTVPGAQVGIVVSFDGDPAGSRALQRAWTVLTALPRAGPLLAATLPTGTDPANLLHQPDGPARLRTALHQTRPLVEAVVDARLHGLLSRAPRLLEDIGGRCEAARALTPYLLHTDPDEFAQAAAHLAARVQISAQTLGILLIDSIAALTSAPGPPPLLRHASTPATGPPVSAAFRSLRVHTTGAPTLRRAPDPQPLRAARTRLA